MENIIGKQLGPYQVIEPLGEGGMAAVYKGYQPGVDRYVALKVLPKRLAEDSEFIGRFQQEAKILAQLQHPHILPVFDYGESEGYTYIVMPFIQGGTLADLLHGHAIPSTEIASAVSSIDETATHQPISTNTPSSTNSPEPTATFAPTNTAVPSPTLIPTVTDIPPTITPSCPPVTGAFANPWNQLQNKIGCATGAVINGLVVEENFQSGKMFWREPLDYAQALVLFNNGTWRIFQHAPYNEGDPEYPCVDANTPAQSPPTPRRGFGTMWCDIPAIRNGLGNAVDVEQGYTGSMQQFDNGFMLSTNNGNTFIFFDNGNWESR